VKYLDEVMQMPESMAFFPGSYYISFQKGIVYTRPLSCQEYIKKGILICAKKPYGGDWFASEDCHYCLYSGDHLRVKYNAFDRIVSSWVDLYANNDRLIGASISGLMLSDAVHVIAQHTKLPEDWRMQL